MSADNQEIQAQPTGLHNHPAIRVERNDSSESLLKAEQERTRRLRQELLIVRSALKQVDELQSELAVERETGKQLVKFLEEAEREARKVPILEHLLRQRGDAEHMVGMYLAGKEPTAQRPEIS